jgi:hypothetical protein
MQLFRPVYIRSYIIRRSAAFNFSALFNIVKNAFRHKGLFEVRAGNWKFLFSSSSALLDYQKMVLISIYARSPYLHATFFFVDLNWGENL